MERRRALRAAHLTFALMMFVAAGASAVRLPIDSCAGLRTLHVGPLAYCTHGADSAGPAASGGTSIPGCVNTIIGCIGTVNVAAPARPATCTTDGVEGARVQVFYARPAGTPNHYAKDLRKIRDAIARADHLLADTAGRHVRWLCSGGTVGVTPIVLRPGAGTLGDFIAAATAAGYASADRIYTAFVDNTKGVTGTGTIENDDRPLPTNENNIGPAYSIAVAYSYNLLVHELGHNLGAVQLSAPHSTGAWHCYDGADIMCRDDGGPYFRSGGTMKQGCPAPAKFDCGGDDYFAPSATGYLATHWNLTLSRFLTL